ncbi:MAG TPA: type II toxin-antitoxin system HicA family toxin [Thermodesulfobacteriota bacterium]|nr:type II toxin-antitoxin system HicA family toxin [Thermodesulfobacteriota bacterium]
MATYRKVLERVLSGRADANIRFDDLRNLLTWLSFHERSRGSHHIFVREGVEELINLQREGNMAKPYQVRQVRTTINKYELEKERDE